MTANIKNRHVQGGEIFEVGGELRILTGGKVTPNTGTQPASIANIANDATGTQIATAVNGILAALRGAGIIAPLP
jgi:hypothetical protein